MARIRSIKPGFFTDDELAEVEPLGRLLFVGLWCLADREGRLEDRPRRIRAEVLPYDDCDIDALLSELDRRGFITRYAAGDQRLIQVTNFARHQAPNVKEPASTIPAPCQHGADTVSVCHFLGREESGKGREGEGNGGARAEHVTRAAPPSKASVCGYFDGIGRVELAEGFFDAYEERGWVTFGRTPVPVHDWQAAARKWVQRHDEWTRGEASTRAESPAASPTPVASRMSRQQRIDAQVEADVQAMVERGEVRMK